jgi:cysteine-rich repeat protein
MSRTGIRAVSAVLGGVALLAITGSAGAQVIPPTAKCEGGKLKCATTFWTGLLGCQSKDSGKPDATALAACEAKSQTKYDGGEATPEKGCFAKLEAKPPCLTIGDSGLVDSLITSSQGPVIQTVLSVDPNFPPSTLSKCASSQQKCVTNLVKGLLGCYSKNATKPDPVKTPACVQKALDKFTGGADPTKGCFQKIEAKMPNDCQTTGHSADLLAATQNYVNNLVATLECGNHRIDAGETCDDGNQTCGDGCSSTCKTEACGNNTVDCGETCDDGNTSNLDNCPSNCVIAACTPNSGSSQFATVNFATSGPAVAGIVVFVDYPEGLVSIPGSGGTPPVPSHVSGNPAGTSAVPNDLDHALRAVVTENTPGATMPAGQLFRINFETCQGAPAPTAGQFTCTVLSASNNAGGDITANVTCSVSVP